MDAGRSLDAVRVTGQVPDRDLTGLVLTECALEGVSAQRAMLRSARLVETRIERIDAPMLDLARSTLRDVEIVGSRIGRWTPSRLSCARCASSAVSSTG